MTFQSTWLSRITTYLSLGSALMLPLMAFSEELSGPPPLSQPSTPDATVGEKFVGPPLPPEPPIPDAAFGEKFVGPLLPPTPPDTMNMLDAPRNYVSGEFVDFVSYIDRFFGNDRNYQEANDSVLQIDMVRVMGRGSDNKFVWSVNANVRLPIAEKKLHLLFETDPDKSPTVDPKQTQSPPLQQPSTPKSYAAALRIEKTAAERWQLRADGGIKFGGLKNSTPFLRARASLAVPMELWRVRLTETLFWFNTTGSGETTRLDLERPISGPVLFRATSVAAWLERAQNVDIRQDLTIYHKRDERTALLYQASAIGVSQPNVHVTNYVLLMLYRYRLHREWMFMELCPQLVYPQAPGSRNNAVISVRLEMLFDEAK